MITRDWGGVVEVLLWEDGTPVCVGDVVEFDCQWMRDPEASSKRVVLGVVPSSGLLELQPVDDPDETETFYNGPRDYGLHWRGL